jgi:hypothetical protein
MKKQVSISDILSAIVFIPQSPILVINIIRSIIKLTFRTLGKIAALLLL